jgi:3-oxoacyl-[acyl-carrier protein] reductase
MELDGKVALVTGGARGIGRAICLALARAGANVIVNYNSSADEAEEVADAIKKLNRRATASRADIGSAHEIVTMFGALVKEFGRLDILVNNAGVALPTDAPIVDYDGAGHFSLEPRALEAWEKMLRVNLTGAAICSQAAAPLLRAAGEGRIINISSLSVITGGGPPGYVVSKAGVMGLTRSLAQELSPMGITVNAIVPGAIRTDMTPTFFPDAKAIARVIAKTPVGRYGQAEDIAEGVAFLASPRASFITGHMLIIDGGRSWSQRIATE